MLLISKAKVLNITFLPGGGGAGGLIAAASASEGRCNDSEAVLASPVVGLPAPQLPSRPPSSWTGPVDADRKEP